MKLINLARIVKETTTECISCRILGDTYRLTYGKLYLVHLTNNNIKTKIYKELL